MTSSTTHNATSSQESVSGRSPFAAPDGQMIDLFGPAPVLANLTPRQARDLGLLIHDTSGRHGAISSESGALQSCLASSLLKRLSMAGLISSRVTLKRLDTPLGRYILQLPHAGSRSSGSGSTLLPSISAREHKDSSRAEVLARLDRGDGVAKRICALSQTLRYSREIVGLNPSFAAWTMAIPVEWVLCMPSETPSTLKRRRSS